MRGAPAPAGRERRDPHGGARAVRLLRELRAALLHRRRDRAGVEPAGRDADTVPRHVQRGRAHRCEAVGITPGKKTVELRERRDRRGDHRAYDKLVLSPGAAPVRPPLPGIDLPGHLPRADRAGRAAIREWIESGAAGLAAWTPTLGSRRARPKTRAVVVGGGFIGLETAENLVAPRLRRHAGRDAASRSWRRSIPRWRATSRATSSRHGVHVALNDGVAGFRQAENGSLEVSRSPASPIRPTS